MAHFIRRLGHISDESFLAVILAARSITEASYDLDVARHIIGGITLTGAATVSIPVGRADLLTPLGGRDGVTLPVPVVPVAEFTAKRTRGYASKRQAYSDDELRAAIEGTRSLAAAAKQLGRGWHNVNLAIERDRLGIPKRSKGAGAKDRGPERTDDEIRDAIASTSNLNDAARKLGWGTSRTIAARDRLGIVARPEGVPHEFLVSKRITPDDETLRAIIEGTPSLEAAADQLGKGWKPVLVAVERNRLGIPPRSPGAHLALARAARGRKAAPTGKEDRPRAAGETFCP